MGLSLGHVVRVGDVALDCWRFEVTTPDGTVGLSPLEFKLLKYLMVHAGRLCTWRELFYKVWRYRGLEGGDYLVRQYVAKLREKIGEHRIVNVRPHGYMMPAEERSEDMGGGSSEVRGLRMALADLQAALDALIDRVGGIERRMRALEKLYNTAAAPEKPKKPAKRRRVKASK